jgi:hypothetical protein
MAGFVPAIRVYPRYLGIRGSRVLGFRELSTKFFAVMFEY